MRIRLAETSDDPQLRRVARETVVPGHIRMVYARDPSFLDSIRSVDDEAQVIVADDGGHIVGEACRSVSDLYVNGAPVAMGYLCGLRVSASARSGTVLARGYAYLKQLHGDNRTAAYLTTIIEGNERATRVLTSKRAGLPLYTPMGTYLAHVLPVRTRPGQLRSLPGCDIVPGSEVPIQDVVKFLNQEGARRQFFPVCRMDGEASALLRGIGLQNTFVAVKGSEVVGVMGMWNQEPHKQCVVAGYSRIFGTLRPCLNAGLRLSGRHPLPPPGNPLRYATAALVCVRQDDADVFDALLAHVMGRAAGSGLHHVALGLHERDPLRPCMERVFHITYRSALYVVSWEGNAFHASLEHARVPYLELGAL